jgi:hypothetical protein
VAGNQAQARSLLAAMKATGFKFGIYSSPGVSHSNQYFIERWKLTKEKQEWSTLFGSTGFVLDNTAPLWFATFNNVQVSIPLTG